MSDQSLHARIVAIAGTDAADRILDLLDEEAAQRCRDADCMRRLPHSRLARHLWRHRPGAPLTRGVFGRRCFNCGHYVWRRIHKPGRQ